MENVRTLLEEGVLEITLDRPARRNALTAKMYTALADAFELAEVDAAVRAIVLAGEGRDFCAGNDLPEFLGAYDLSSGTPWRRFLDALPRTTKPIIAAVQGNAVGIGLTMLLHFDLIYLEPDARLSAPFSRLGVVPEAGSSGLLPALIGRARANGLFLLGQTIDAVEAVRVGLANAVVAETTARLTAVAAARLIATLPHGAVRGLKHLLESPSAISERIEIECKAFMDRVRDPETRQLLRALAATYSSKGYC